MAEELKELAKLVINKSDLKKLKALYNKADPGEVFEFKGEQVLKEYAKYLIEYLETKLK